MKDGVSTTEFDRAKSSGLWGIVALVLGMMITMLSAIVPQVSGTSEVAGIVIGGLVSVLGILQKALVDMGYIKSRTAVKTANNK